MHSNGTLPLDMLLDAPLAARCGYSFKMFRLFLMSMISNIKEEKGLILSQIFARRILIMIQMLRYFVMRHNSII